MKNKRIKRLFERLDSVDAVILSNNIHSFVDINTIYFGDGAPLNQGYLLLKQEGVLAFPTLTELVSQLEHNIRIGYNSNFLSSEERKIIITTTHPKETIDVSQVLSFLRLIKEPYEVEMIKSAAQITENVLNKAKSELKPGISERTMYECINDLIISSKSEGPAFVGCCAFGENTSIHNHRYSNKKLRKKDCVILDFGALKNYYASDISKCLTIGYPKKEFVELYEIAIKIREDLKERFIPGARIKDVCYSILNNLGEKKRYIKHSFGHDLGLSLPYSFAKTTKINENNNLEISENMVFAIEVGLYKKKYGIRIEDAFIVNKTGLSPLLNNLQELEVLN